MDGPRPPLNLNINSEGEPLLHAARAPPCLRYVWIAFFGVFLCVGLIVGLYLLVTEGMDLPVSSGSYSLISRKSWRAEKATYTIPKLQIPIERVVLTSTNTSECSTKSQCFKEVHNVQKDHLNRLGEPDIGYNFLIAGDGQTYEGRGWKYRGTVSYTNDNRTLVVAFVGIFNDSVPTNKQIDQVRSFLETAEGKGKLKTCYAIEGEYTNNASKTDGYFAGLTAYLEKYFKRRRHLC